MKTTNDHCYGELPNLIGTFEVDCSEFMFYQYLPIKLVGQTTTTVEPRLNCFSPIINAARFNYLNKFGFDSFVNSYVYLTVKHMFTKPDLPMNRPGWHTDGFLTDDINYIWSDCLPTIFNYTEFYLTLDDDVSLEEMERQANHSKNIQYENFALLRLNQFNVHRIATPDELLLRTFLKISISLDKYDLIGNSHNYLLDYNWTMRKRNTTRNVPQVLDNVL